MQARETRSLKRIFLEIAGISDHGLWSSLPLALRQRFGLDAQLSRYEGIHMLYLDTENIGAVHARLLADCLPTSEIGQMSRDVLTLDGEETLNAKFIHAPSVSISQHENPRVLFQPQYMNHRNRVKGLTECIMCTNDPSQLASTYSSYAGQPPQQQGQIYVVDLGLSSVIVVAPEHIGELIPDCIPPSLPFFAGFTVSTGSLDEVRALLTERNVSFQEHADRVIVRPQDACGSAVIFEKEGMTRL